MAKWDESGKCEVQIWLIWQHTDKILLNTCVHFTRHSNIIFLKFTHTNSNTLLMFSFQVVGNLIKANNAHHLTFVVKEFMFCLQIKKKKKSDPTLAWDFTCRYFFFLAEQQQNNNNNNDLKMKFWLWIIFEW